MPRAKSGCNHQQLIRLCACKDLRAELLIMRKSNLLFKSNSYKNQQGIALLILLLILGSGALYALLRTLNQNNLQIERDRKTTDALAMAKEALIGHAVKMALQKTGFERAGDLPCPDLDNDGKSNNTCGAASGITQQATRLGRLPWITLGLPDLRDGYGERLWYAVSNNFKDSNRHTPLNSSTYGTITVRDTLGSISHNGNTATGAVAIIFSPGQPLMREGALSMQDRNCANAGECTSSICSTSPASLTPSCNPINYLDRALGEDNANFIDSNNNDGFINGIIKDAGGNILVNDELRVISYEDVMPAIERRVVGEVAKCLTEYATSNLGRYPWAAPLDPSAPPSYADVANTYLGHLPDPLFTQTKNSGYDTSSFIYKMNDHWVGLCGIGAGWWKVNNWNEHVFYALAPDFAPASTQASACSGACLTVNGLTAPQINKQFVVMVAGGALTGQARNTILQKGSTANYLESRNANPWPNYQFQRGAVSEYFNDVVQFYPR
jgi:hypothetical protein